MFELTPICSNITLIRFSCELGKQLPDMALYMLGEEIFKRAPTSHTVITLLVNIGSQTTYEFLWGILVILN